eukprot:5115820-Pyramimonas_sp.AAC.1
MQPERQPAREAATGRQRTKVRKRQPAYGAATTRPRADNGTKQGNASKFFSGQARSLKCKRCYGNVAISIAPPRSTHNQADFAMFGSAAQWPHSSLKHEMVPAWTPDL